MTVINIMQNPPAALFTAFPPPVFLHEKSAVAETGTQSPFLHVALDYRSVNF
jgi:hypothetical protein